MRENLKAVKLVDWDSENYILLIDLKAAYDNVVHSILFRKQAAKAD
jgi:hypothetical protein